MTSMHICFCNLPSLIFLLGGLQAAEGTVVMTQPKQLLNSISTISDRNGMYVLLYHLFNSI